MITIIEAVKALQKEYPGVIPQKVVDHKNMYVFIGHYPNEETLDNVFPINKLTGKAIVWNPWSDPSFMASCRTSMTDLEKLQRENK